MSIWKGYSHYSWVELKLHINKLICVCRAALFKRRSTLKMEVLFVRVRKILIFLVLSIKSIVYITLLIIILNNFIQANDPHHILKREVIAYLEQQIQYNHLYEKDSFLDIHPDSPIGTYYMHSVEDKEMLLEILKRARPSRYFSGRWHGSSIIVENFRICVVHYGRIDNSIAISGENFRTFFFTLPRDDFMILSALVVPRRDN